MENIAMEVCRRNPQCSRSGYTQGWQSTLRSSAQGSPACDSSIIELRPGGCRALRRQGTSITAAAIKAADVESLRQQLDAAGARCKAQRRAAEASVAREAEAYAEVATLRSALAAARSDAAAAHRSAAEAQKRVAEAAVLARAREAKAAELRTVRCLLEDEATHNAMRLSRQAHSLQAGRLEAVRLEREVASLRRENARLLEALEAGQQEAAAAQREAAAKCGRLERAATFCLEEIERLRAGQAAAAAQAAEQASQIGALRSQLEVERASASASASAAPHRHHHQGNVDAAAELDRTRVELACWRRQCRALRSTSGKLLALLQGGDLGQGQQQAEEQQQQQQQQESVDDASSWSATGAFAFLRIPSPAAAAEGCCCGVHAHAAAEPSPASVCCSHYSHPSHCSHGGGSRGSHRGSPLSSPSGSVVLSWQASGRDDSGSEGSGGEGSDGEGEGGADASSPSEEAGRCLSLKHIC